MAVVLHFCSSGEGISPGVGIFYLHGPVWLYPWTLLLFSTPVALGRGYALGWGYFTCMVLFGLIPGQCCCPPPLMGGNQPWDGDILPAWSCLALSLDMAVVLHSCSSGEGISPGVGIFYLHGPVWPYPWTWLLSSTPVALGRGSALGWGYFTCMVLFGFIAGHGCCLPLPGKGSALGWGYFTCMVLFGLIPGHGCCPPLLKLWGGDQPCGIGGNSSPLFGLPPAWVIFTDDLQNDKIKLYTGTIYLCLVEINLRAYQLLTLTLMQFINAFVPPFIQWFLTLNLVYLSHETSFSDIKPCQIIFYYNMYIKICACEKATVPCQQNITTHSWIYVGKETANLV